MAKVSNNKVQQGHIKRKGVIDVAPNGEEISFKAYNEGEPAHRNVHSCQGGGKRFETIGKKEPKLMLNLQCLLSAPDAYEQLSEQFDRLTKDLNLISSPLGAISTTPLRLTGVFFSFSFIDYAFVFHLQLIEIPFHTCTMKL